MSYFAENSNQKVSFNKDMEEDDFSPVFPEPSLPTGRPNNNDDVTPNEKPNDNNDSVNNNKEGDDGVNMILSQASQDYEKAMNETQQDIRALLKCLSHFLQTSTECARNLETIQQSEHSEAARLDAIEPDVQGATTVSFPSV